MSIHKKGFYKCNWQIIIRIFSSLKKKEYRLARSKLTYYLHADITLKGSPVESTLNLIKRIINLKKILYIVVI